MFPKDSQILVDDLGTKILETSKEISIKSIQRASI